MTPTLMKNLKEVMTNKRMNSPLMPLSKTNHNRVQVESMTKMKKWKRIEKKL